MSFQDTKKLTDYVFTIYLLSEEPSLKPYVSPILQEHCNMWEELEPF